MLSMNLDLLTELLHLPAPWRIEDWELGRKGCVLRVEVGWPVDVAVYCPVCHRGAAINHNCIRRTL